MDAMNIISKLAVGETVTIRLGNQSDIDYCPSAQGVVLETTITTALPQCACVVKNSKGDLVLLPNVTVNRYAEGDESAPAFYATCAFAVGEELFKCKGGAYASRIDLLVNLYALPISKIEPYFEKNEKRPEAMVATPVVANSESKPVPAIRTPFQITYECEKVKSIPFNPEWHNGTGYFDGAIQGDTAVKLEIGELAKSISPMPNNRKLLFVGTRFGTVCLFQRFTDKYETITQHVPDDVRRLDISGLNGALSQDMQAWVLGPWGDNIGQWIEKVAKMFAPKA